MMQTFTRLLAGAGTMFVLAPNLRPVTPGSRDMRDDIRAIQGDTRKVAGDWHAAIQKRTYQKALQHRRAAK